MKQIKEHSLVRTIALVLIALTLFASPLWCDLAAKRLFRDDDPGFGPIDVARRVTSPDWTKTAILARSYASFLDLNFALYVTDDEYADVTRGDEDALFIAGDDAVAQPDAALWIQRALWISPDYEPTTGKNWREDIEWSGDSTVVAVIIEDEYTFAYDFTSETGTQASETIRKWIDEHSIQN